jgi:disulfide bond formation protein DsbB
MGKYDFLNDVISVSLIIIAISAGSLATAYFFQFVIGLQPCMLCLYQRIPHALEIILGFLAFFTAYKRKKPKKSAFFILLASVLYFGSAVLALYHTGVEHHWWVSILEACTNPLISTGSKDLLSQIEKAESVRCDSVPWQMFGISMAGYNAILSSVMFAYTMVAAIMITRRANGL